MVLGISLGTTTTGIAVLSGGELILWHTHSFRDTWSDDKAALIAACYERYVTQYRPGIVILKIPPLHHHSDAIRQLLRKVGSLFEYHGCMVEYKTKEDVKAAMGNVDNHGHLMRHAVELYPILLPEYAKAVGGKNRYHNKLFDAVMVAHQGKILLQKRAAQASLAAFPLNAPP